MMKCITAARTSLFYNTQQQHYHHRNSEARSWPQPHRRLYANTQTTRQALLLSDLVVVLADANTIAQPKGDIKVFLQTGYIIFSYFCYSWPQCLIVMGWFQNIFSCRGMLLSAYMLANFVVPSIVLKQLDAAAKEPESTSNEQQPPKKKMEKKNQGWRSITWFNRPALGMAWRGSP